MCLGTKPEEGDTSAAAQVVKPLEIFSMNQRVNEAAARAAEGVLGAFREPRRAVEALERHGVTLSAFRRQGGRAGRLCIGDAHERRLQEENERSPLDATWPMTRASSRGLSVHSPCRTHYRHDKTHIRREKTHEITAIGTSTHLRIRLPTRASCADCHPMAQALRLDAFGIPPRRRGFAERRSRSPHPGREASKSVPAMGGTFPLKIHP